MSTEEDTLLREVALRNASTILKVSRRTRDELIEAKYQLERRTDELARSLAMMEATLNAATDGILVTDGQRRVTAFNEKFVQIWQVPASVLQHCDHETLASVIAGFVVDRIAHVSRVKEIYRSAEPTSFDVLELTDGRVVERQSSPQLLDGQVAGRVWSFRDITAQRRSEEALRDETRVLELVNATGRELATLHDLRSVVQAVTDAGTEMIGAQFGVLFYLVTDGKGDTCFLNASSGAPADAFMGLGQPRSNPLFGPTLGGAPPGRSNDILQDPRYAPWEPHGGLPPGDLQVRSFLAVPVVARCGEVIGGLFFGHAHTCVFDERAEKIITGIAAQAAVAIDNARLHDAAQAASTEREMLLESERSARSLAERMSSLKDDFLATLSHELRTPMSSILGWVQVIRRGSDKPQDIRKGLDVIERSARVQSQLIDDLLDMNRIASGKVRLDIQPLHPISFIEAALETVMPAADAKNVRIERALDSSAGPVPGDPGRLQQVMINLLGNAIKFTPKGGKVQVLLARVHSDVEIIVSDSGIGIAPALIPHVFERFRQADGSTSRQYGGLGLGLAIVESLVELHGGTVKASSAGEGQGSAFHVRLPVVLDQGYAADSDFSDLTAGSKAGAGDVCDLSGLVVLVVDDSQDGRELARRMLEDCGASVLTAGNALDGLRMIEAQRPDVLISDIGMPDVDGFEFLRRVRAMGAERGGDVPAVALTAFARAQDRVLVLRSGFGMHLAKPADVRELAAVVATAARRKH